MGYNLPRFVRIVLSIVVLGLGGLGTAISRAEDEPTAPVSATQPANEMSTSAPSDEADQPTSSPADAATVEEGAAQSQTARGPGRRGRGRPKPVKAGEVTNAVIIGGRILTMDGEDRVINGSVVIRDGKIKSISDGEAPMDPGSVNVKAAGRYVTPGLIDAWSGLGLDSGGPSGGGKASLSTADAIDGFDRHDFEQAVRHGVTAVCVEPGAGNGVAGVASLLRIEDIGDPAAEVTRDVALVIRVGLGRLGPFGRMSAVKSIREQLTSAKDYRESWEEYEEELEKYKKDLKSGKTVKLKEGEGEEKQAEPKKPEPPSPERRGRGRRRGRSVDDFHLHGDSDEKHGPVGPVPNDGLPRCPRHPWVVVVCCCPEDEEQETHCEHDHLDEVELPDWLTLDEGGEKSKKKDEKGKDEFNKPDLPDRNPDQEVFVKALKHEIPVRFEVHRPADIVAVLGLIEEFNLEATISGGSGAGIVAEQLSDAGVPVLLDEFIPGPSFDVSHTRDLRFDNVERLAQANVEVAIGAGTVNGRPRTAYLAQNAAIAAGYGLANDAALRAITINAARACGAADKIGSIEKGKLGDVVVWKGHPLSPDAVVEYVFVGGRQVYPAP